MERYDPTTEAISPINRALINRVCPSNRGVTKWMPADLDRLLDAARREASSAENASQLHLRNLFHEVIGAYVIAQAYADTFPDDAEDATDMKFGQHYWEGVASNWAGEDLLSCAHEAAKARMRVENPAQVRDLDWSAAMSDLVASGGLPRDGEDPVCTDCGGTGVCYQTERRCACQPESRAFRGED
jgi:hypothetical protein